MAKTPSKIPGQVSNEADKNQLKLAKKQGDVFEEALNEMEHETGRGKSQTVHDYIITLTCEKAEGMWHWQDGQLVWRNPKDENVHFEVVIRDAQDRRFVPYLDVHITLFNHSNELLYTEKLPFVWHPWLYHYGKNMKVPSSGNYHVEVEVSQFPLNRHDKRNGNRMAKLANARFELFPVATGQKLD